MFDKITDQMRYNDNYDVHIFHRDYALKAFSEILRKRKNYCVNIHRCTAYIHQEIDHEKVIRQYLEIYLRANSLSIIRLHCANTLLFLAEKCKQSFLSAALTVSKTKKLFSMSFQIILFV